MVLGPWWRWYRPEDAFICVGRAGMASTAVPLDASQPVRVHNARPVATLDSPRVGSDLGDDLPCNPAVLIHVDFDRAVCRVAAVVLPVRVILRGIVEGLVTLVTEVRLALDEGDVHAATERAESMGKLGHDRWGVVLASGVIGGLLGWPWFGWDQAPGMRDC